MYEFFRDLDRRWIFLAMFLAIALPIIFQSRFPEQPTGLSQSTFEKIEQLEEGDLVLMAYDYDPASEGELGPMATSFVYHCAKKKVRMCFLTLWPAGPPMIDKVVNNVLNADFPEYAYGVDYVNLGYKAGDEGVIKVIVTDLAQMYPTDSEGTPLSDLPMLADVNDIQAFDLIVNVSAGYAGTKEWVLYAVTPYDLDIVAGCTGVQAPILYPYVPDQLPGLLGAIKGAAEYEKLVFEKYGDDVRGPDGELPDKYVEGARRMGPQLIAHLLMIALILGGNIIYFIGRRRGEER